MGRGGWGEKGRDLGEVPLEPHGRDYLKRPRRRLARVPEGLRHAPWLEDQVAGSGDADLAPDLTFEHVGVFVRTLVGVQRRGEDAGPDRVLDEREGTLGLLSSDHEPYAKLTEPHRLALIRREQYARPLVHQFAHKRPPLLVSMNTAFIERSAPYTYPISLSISFDIVFSEMADKRKYEMKRRAERQRETRRRIVEATVELHRTRGPANTTISEIAQRAGVNRLTVYNHFPDVTDLLKACSRSWTERHPAPDPTPWAQISDPQVRLRTALADLYSFYARTEPMRANVLRDAQTMPELAALLEGSVVPYLVAVRDLLAEGWEVSGDRRKRLLATLKLAIDFHTWRSLERESGLGREEAVEVMLEAVRSAVSLRGA